MQPYCVQTTQCYRILKRAIKRREAMGCTDFLVLNKMCNNLFFFSKGGRNGGGPRRKKHGADCRQKIVFSQNTLFFAWDLEKFQATRIQGPLIYGARIIQRHPYSQYSNAELRALAEDADSTVGVFSPQDDALLVLPRIGEPAVSILHPIAKKSP